MILTGLAASVLMFVVYATFDLARAVQNNAVETVFAIVAPTAVALLLTWLAFRQAWQGRLLLGSLILAPAYLLILIYGFSIVFFA